MQQHRGAAHAATPRCRSCSSESRLDCLVLPTPWRSCRSEWRLDCLVLTGATDVPLMQQRVPPRLPRTHEPLMCHSYSSAEVPLMQQRAPLMQQRVPPRLATDAVPLMQQLAALQKSSPAIGAAAGDRSEPRFVHAVRPLRLDVKRGDTRCDAKCMAMEGLRMEGKQRVHGALVRKAARQAQYAELGCGSGPSTRSAPPAANSTPTQAHGGVCARYTAFLTRSLPALSRDGDLRGRQRLFKTALLPAAIAWSSPA
jgi:hypothetical protein